MTKQCDKVEKQEFHRDMTEINKIAANMDFCGEKNQEQNSALIMKINRSETSQYPIESPMSNLAFRLGISKIATPKVHKSPEMFGSNNNEDETAFKNIINEKCKVQSDKLIDKNDLISQIVSSVESSPITRHSSRRPLISPQNINFDLKSDLQTDEDEDISFYPLNRPFYGVKLNDEYISSSDEQNKIRDQMTAPLLTLVEPNSPKKCDLKSSENVRETPSKYTIMSNVSCRLGNGFKVYDSISSGSNESNEMEDEYLELMEMENLDEETQMPSDLSSLLCKDVKTLKSPNGTKCSDMDKLTEHDSFAIPKFNHITSLFPTPDRQCLATINENMTSFGNNRSTAGAFKRPEPPTVNPSKSKRHKGEKDDLKSSIIIPLQVKRPSLRKTVSMNDAATIMDALSRSSEDTDLIGDFSKKFCLPFIDGRHTDLRSISVITMRSLLMGEFDDYVSSYKIIDCRYPYEYEGGHIIGAINLYTQDQIIEELVNKKTPEVPNVDGENRNILIFHCEFSSERGPKLSRFLRNHDRMSSPYPTLQYPEIYLLHGGYKEFFLNNSDLCEPHSYRPMLDTNFTNEYKHFRAKSKSWTGDGRSSNRFSKSRSRLIL